MSLLNRLARAEKTVREQASGDRPTIFHLDAAGQPHTADRKGRLIAFTRKIEWPALLLVDVDPQRVLGLSAEHEDSLP